MIGPFQVRLRLQVAAWRSSMSSKLQSGLERANHKLVSWKLIKTIKEFCKFVEEQTKSQEILESSANEVTENEGGATGQSATENEAAEEEDEDEQQGGTPDATQVLTEA